MSLALTPGKSIKSELRRVARKELRDASERLLRDDRDEGDVHQGRKSVKKVAAVANLLDEIGVKVRARDTKGLHAASRALSTLRDADAMIETFEHLRSRFPHRLPKRTSATILTQLERRKASMTRGMHSPAGRFAAAGEALKQIRRSARGWVAPPTDLSDLIAVLRRSFRACRKAMQCAQQTELAEDFHAWRKTVKKLWYQLRLVERLVSGLTKQLEEFRELETMLGEEHDLVVLRTQLTRDRTLKGLGAQVDRVAAMSAALQEELRRSAIVLGRRLFKLSPKAFALDLERRLRPEGTPRRKPAPRTRSRMVV